MDQQKQQVVERLQQANNILVTVSNNPSVDQLAACIGLTLSLNKLGKHATAVFSGAVPSTIEFLQPERTLEKNTDSLRDFIIALDKSKADKLRYKVEDRMVKIFITPYRTSISQKDLDFSQGDFNVDVVLALGVHNQNELDQAITSHGRILHDATVMTVNVKPGGELGSVNWIDPNASSLSELGVQLVDVLDKKVMDGQIATAFLTGVIAETERFSNNKTSPQTMSISAELMSSGANQQLVATKLEEPVAPPKPQPILEDNSTKSPNKIPEPVAPPKPDDGTIEIDHEGNGLPQLPNLSLPGQPPLPENEPKPEEPDIPQPQAPQIHIDDQGQLQPMQNNNANNAPQDKSEDKLPDIKPLPNIRHEETSKLLTDPAPPRFGGSPMSASAQGDSEDEPSTDPLSVPSVGLLNREPLPSQQPKHLVVQPPSASTQNNTPEPPLTPALSLPGANLPPALPAAPTSGPIVQPPAIHPANQPQMPAAQPPSKTLSEIEEELDSPHLSDTSVPLMPTPAQPNTSSVIKPQAATPASLSTNVDDARSAVEQALNGNPNASFEPIQALNANPLGNVVQHDAPAPSLGQPMVNPGAPQPQQPVSFEPMPNTQPNQQGTTPPPAVPPPMMPPTFPGAPQ